MSHVVHTSNLSWLCVPCIAQICSCCPLLHTVWQASELPSWFLLGFCESLLLSSWFWDIRSDIHAVYASMLSVSWFWFGSNHDMPTGVGLLHGHVFPVVYVFACHILKMPCLKMTVVRPGVFTSMLVLHICVRAFSSVWSDVSSRCLLLVYSVTVVVSSFSSLICFVDDMKCSRSKNAHTIIARSHSFERTHN